MSRTGTVRNYDRHRYWRERAEYYRWLEKEPKYLLISHWLWWRERPKWL